MHLTSSNRKFNSIYLQTLGEVVGLNQIPANLKNKSKSTIFEICCNFLNPESIYLYTIISCSVKFSIKVSAFTEYFLLSAIEASFLIKFKVKEKNSFWFLYKFIAWKDFWTYEDSYSLVSKIKERKSERGIEFLDESFPSFNSEERVLLFLLIDPLLLHMPRAMLTTWNVSVNMLFIGSIYWIKRILIFFFLGPFMFHFFYFSNYYFLYFPFFIWFAA